MDKRFALFVRHHYNDVQNSMTANGTLNSSATYTNLRFAELMGELDSAITISVFISSDYLMAYIN